MSGNQITSSDIESGKPVVGPQGFGKKVKDQFDELYGIIGSLRSNDISNGSFELCSLNDGKSPDSWTISDYPGGAHALNTTDPAHGNTCLTFTHPGGVGNGGGKAVTDYLPVDDISNQFVSFLYKCTAGANKNQVSLNYYNASKVELGAGSPSVIFTSTKNHTFWAYAQAYFNPPAGTRFIKITMIGGNSDTNVAGTTYFDNVSINNNPDMIFAPSEVLVMTEAYSNAGSYTDVVATTINIPKGGPSVSPANVTFAAQLRSTGDGMLVYMRFKVSDGTNTVFSNDVSSASTVYADFTPVFSMATLIPGVLTITLQLRSENPVYYAYGKVAGSTPYIF